MVVVVRELSESDRGALRELFVSARNASFSWAASSEHKVEDFDAVTDGERVLVAVSEHRPIGFASVWEETNFLHNLFVHPQFQGQGVGTMLLAGCEKVFAGVATLKCVKANARAVRFYQSHGWKVRSEAEGPDGMYLLMEFESTNRKAGAQDHGAVRG